MVRKIVYLLVFAIHGFGVVAQNNISVDASLDSAKFYAEKQEYIMAYSYGVQALQLLNDDAAKNKTLAVQLSAYQQYFKLTNQVISDLSEPNFKKIFYQLEYQAYERTINLVHQIYEKKPTEELFEYALNLSERNRNVLLVETIKGQKNETTSEQLLKKEAELLVLIQTYLDSLTAEKTKELPDEATVERLEKNRDKYQAAYEKIKVNSENQEENQTIQVKVIQSNLSKEETFVAYFYGEKGFYAFVINKESVFFYKDEGEDFLSEIVKGYRSTIHKNEMAWVGYSQGLYQKVIAPLKKHLKEKLIVVADGLLAYIPLEGLVKNAPKNWNYDFKALEYVIEDYQISYQHSAHLYLEQQQKKSSIQYPKLLAIAPDFDEQNQQKAKKYAIEDTVYWSLNKLEQADDVIEFCEKNFPTTPLFSEFATLENLKKHLNNHQIIHFATHTLINELSPLDSKIALSAASTGHYLYLKDLYELTLNADLVVLSSCETGSGQYQLGDGVMSIAYGFNFAGVPSLIYTLWQVDEAATYEIVKEFYKQLKSGKSKDKALRMAKLHYLKSANEVTADPYYWSGLVMHGDTTGFEMKKDFSYWWLAVVLGVSGLFWFFVFKKKAIIE